MEHQGATLEKAVRNSDISIKRLAEILKVNRKTVYYWFGNRRLSPEVLIRINNVIKSDFLKPRAFGEPGQSVSENRQEIEFWKTKYLDLLDRYNFFLKEKCR